jgi:integrase
MGRILGDAPHTSATTGADAGVPEHIMQRRLGHADARTTRDIYTYVLPKSERKAAEVNGGDLASRREVIRGN